MYKWETDEKHFPYCSRLIDEADPGYVLAYVDKTSWSYMTVAIIFPAKGVDLCRSRVQIFRDKETAQLEVQKTLGITNAMRPSTPENGEQ